jgi:hypothetical protein
MDDKINKIVIEIETVNSAFKDGNCGVEVRNILEKIANHIKNNDDTISTMWKRFADTNGNTCCIVTVK